jgi:hypothetical protein
VQWHTQQHTALPPLAHTHTTDTHHCKQHHLHPCVQEALGALDADRDAKHALGHVLGAELLRACLAVRRCEAEHGGSVAEDLLRY